jgi:hypothetical protein
MSALPLKADMLSVSIDVRYVPEADLSKRCWLSVRIPRRSQRGGFCDTLA